MCGKSFVGRACLPGRESDDGWANKADVLRARKKK